MRKMLMHMKSQHILIILVIVFSLFIFIKLNVFQKAERLSSGYKIHAVASIYPLYFFAKEIGGEKAEITNLIPAGVEPHEYELTSQDVVRIEKSNLLILNGGMEPWRNKLEQNLQGGKVHLVVAGASLLSEVVPGENGNVQPDPHVWLSPPLAKREVDEITKAFETSDPTNSEYYLANAKKLEKRLDQLDTRFLQGLSHCKQKSIITSHAAFGYLAKTYNFGQIAIVGLSPDMEPSPKKLAETAAFAKTNGIKYIFFESLVNPRLSQTLAKEIGATTLTLNPLEGLTQEEIIENNDYFTIQSQNLINLRIALECQ